MQSNVIVAESIGHRARFAWIGAALAATVALLVASSVMSDPRPSREVAQQRYQKAEWKQHRCYSARKRAEARLDARFEAERAERRARLEAERAERRARLDAERARERAERARERAERARERAERRARIDLHE